METVHKNEVPSSYSLKRKQRQEHNLSQPTLDNPRATTAATAITEKSKSKCYQRASRHQRWQQQRILSNDNRYRCRYKVTKSYSRQLSKCHILIMLIMMLLLIVNYGGSTAQMSTIVPYLLAVPESPLPHATMAKQANSLSMPQWRDTIISKEERENIEEILNKIKKINANLLATPDAVDKTNLKKKHSLYGNDNTDDKQQYGEVENLGQFDKDKTMQQQQQQLFKKFSSFRKSRLLGLLFGTNYSLSFNLTVGGSNSAGNITVVAPAAAPAYYYAPAPAYYPYGYGYGYGYGYDPYGAYYNPYGYNPYAGYYG